MVAPRCLSGIDVLWVDRYYLRIHLSMIILKLGCLVASMEILNSLAVLLLNLFLSLSLCLIELKIDLNFVALDTHDSHEVICWVAELWAFKLRS